MNTYNLKSNLRLGGLLLTVAAARLSFGQYADATGTIGATRLDMFFGGAMSSQTDYSGVVNFDIGPGFHYTTEVGPYLNSDPTQVLYTAIESLAGGSSTAGGQVVSTRSWFLTNNTGISQVAVLDYTFQMTTDSVVSDPVNQGATNVDSVDLYNSQTGLYTQVSGVSSSSAVSSADYHVVNVNGGTRYTLTPGESATIQFQETSISYATSLATPEPAPVVALSAGFGLLILKRRRG